MIIECINCSRKFNLNENILEPGGSKVRCTKCGQIFRAFPISPDRGDQSLPKDEEMITKDVNNYKTDTLTTEQSMNHRVKVSVPASCVSTDADRNSLDLSIGTITEVSQHSLSIELFCSSSFDFAWISFIAFADKEIQIRGKVNHRKTNPLGKKKIELSLLGTPKEIADFISQLVRCHHYTVSSAQNSENSQYLKTVEPQI
jgi:predicted Zn finger-like uncharacterized protein